VQKAIQLVLEVIFEKEFLDISHGFRLNRSCHTALKDLYGKAKGFFWVIEGDIEKCFDTIPHKVIMECLEKRISCIGMRKLIFKLLKAGKIDAVTKQFRRSNFGIPQGLVISPLLCNIVLNELDSFFEKEIQPNYTKGFIRGACSEYRAI